MNCLWLSILTSLVIRGSFKHDDNERKCPQNNQAVESTESSLYSDMFLVKEELSWEEAVNYCRNNHSDLVTISSPDQEEQVKRRAREANSNTVWLGANYTCLLELWRWTSGEFMVYQQWRGCPASECGQAAAMEKKGNNKWVKKSQHERYNFICAKLKSEENNYTG